VNNFQLQLFINGLIQSSLHWIVILGYFHKDFLILFYFKVRRLEYLLLNKSIYRIILDNNQQSRLITALSYFITKISMNTLYDIVTYFPPSNQTQIFTPTDVSQFET